jgi:hypothetical protein
MFTSKRVLALLTAALVPALALAFLVAGRAQKAAGAGSRASASAIPSASQFAHDFVGVTNRYAQKNGDGASAGDAHCVEAAPGQYMCSYLLTVQGMTTCHLMQAQWTPESPSAITVTLAGRTGRCGTLRDAIQSLG